MNETYKIRYIGGALVVTLPRHVLKQIEPPIKAGDEAVISIQKVRGKRGLIMIEPLPRKGGRRG